jgi:uncharacterized protein DUF6226
MESMSRGGVDGPPKDAYGRVTDAVRFAPLHKIARQVLEGLETRYDVTRQSFTEIDPHGSEPAAAVRLVPADPAAAPLAIVFDAFPGLLVRSGRQDADGVYLPHCGCDACDDSVVDCTEELARLIDATTAGTFGERLVYADGAWWHEAWYRTPTSTVRGRSRLNGRRLAVLRKAIPGGELVWAPWPERSGRQTRR